MFDADGKVRQALSAACACVRHGRKKGAPEGETLIWQRTGGACAARADGREALSALTYTIDVFADTIARAKEIAAFADEGMEAIGFRRESCGEIDEEEGARIRSTWTGFADGEGRIYGSG